jgi:hypothetical protein
LNCVLRLTVIMILSIFSLPLMVIMKRGSSRLGPEIISTNEEGNDLDE